MNILNNLKNNSLINSELEEFINNHFQEIYDFFYNQTQIDLYKHKQEIKQYLRQAKKQIISLDCSNKINGDFIALIIETCEKLHLFMEFKLFYEYLSKSIYTLGNRLESSHYYCNDIKKFEDYYDKYPVILDLLKRAYIEEEDSKEKLTATFINFYSTIIYDFGERNKQNVLKLKNAIFDKVKDSTYLDKEFINIIFNINISNFRKAYNDIIRILNDYLYRKDLISCQIDNYIKIEVGEYTKKLQEFDNPTFDKIFQVSKDYIENNIDDQDKIHYSLQRGTKILQTEEELYQYIKSFGKMHKAKLYSAFDTIIYMLKNQKINIIDWGCGQAFATFLLMDYIKEKKLNINVSNITLIEPSQIALSRGLLHIDILKENFIEVRAINKEIDCLEDTDLLMNNSNITLHLFSNILDVETFKLDKQFLEKISHSQNGLNYFICVSPNINDKRNFRLDIFYRYFNDNFMVELISERDNNIGNYKRYEKIFKVLNFKKII